MCASHFVRTCGTRSIPLLRHPHSGYSCHRNSPFFPIRPLLRHPSHFQPAHSQRVTEETLTSLAFAFAFALCYARLPGFAFHFPVFPSSSFPYDQVNLMTPGISIVSHNPGKKLKARNTCVAPHPFRPCRRQDMPPTLQYPPDRYHHTLLPQTSHVRYTPQPRP